LGPPIHAEANEKLGKDYQAVPSDIIPLSGSGRYTVGQGILLGNFFQFVVFVQLRCYRLQSGDPDPVQDFFKI
jgi:hypothetical protein